ncbi:type II secretion system protein [bacterium]|nr:type II secretion system protein [bacterium]
MKKKAGVNLLEMIIVVAILGIVAIFAIPYAEIILVRTYEIELENNLDLIRRALQKWRKDCEDTVKRDRGEGALVNVPNENMYPPDLGSLSKSMPFTVYDKFGNATATFYPYPYLYKLPKDPLIGRAVWMQYYASYSSDVNSSSTFDTGRITPSNVVATGVFDISGHPDPTIRRGFVTAIDNTNYSDW